MRADFEFFLKKVKKAPYKGARGVYSLEYLTFLSGLCIMFLLSK